MKKLALFAVLAIAGAAASANAYEIRARFVEQRSGGGSDFVVLDGNTIDATDGAARRIRVQFGVFDDANGPAPAGGFIGWNAGTITVNGDVANSDDTRTPGRLAPWAFNTNPGANGSPDVAGPFTALTGIDNTLGTQIRTWEEGDMPAATIRGLNTYVSLYEITIDPNDGASTYTIDFAGNLVAATVWNAVGVTQPDPDAGVPGSGQWAPATTAPVAWNATLTVSIIPAPGAAALLGLGGLVAMRRRR